MKSLIISMQLTCASSVGLPFFPDGVEEMELLDISLLRAANFILGVAILSSR